MRYVLIALLVMAGTLCAQDPPPCETTLEAVLPTCPDDADGSLTVVGDVGGPFTYTWFHDAALTGPTATNLLADHYSVLVTGDSCAVLLEYDLPDPEVAPLGTMAFTHISCPGASDGTVTFTVAPGPYTWQWIDDPNQTNTTLTGLGPGTYTAVVYGGPCPSYVSATLGDPYLHIAGESDYCATSPPTLSAAPQWGFEPDVYLWSTGATTSSIAIAAGTEGVISLTVTDTDLGCTLTGQITLSQRVGPEVAFSAPDTLCIHTLGVATTTSAVATLLWQWGDTGTSTITEPSITFDTPYWQPISLQGFDHTGCGGTPALDSVYVRPKLPADFTAAQVPCSSLLELRFNSASDSCAFFIGDSLFLDLCRGTVRLDMRQYQDLDLTFYSTQPDRCDDTTSIALQLIEEPILFLPNAFTPNGDGINDVWPGLVAIPEEDFDLEVFDRWGYSHWHTTDTQDRWTGLALPTGVYIYTVRMRNPCMPLETITRQGTVTLVR